MKYTKLFTSNMATDIFAIQQLTPSQKEEAIRHILDNNPHKIFFPREFLGSRYAARHGGRRFYTEAFKDRKSGEEYLKDKRLVTEYDEPIDATEFLNEFYPKL